MWGNGSSSSFQMFSDYQAQNMSDNFADAFGFGDNDFNENEDGGG